MADPAPIIAVQPPDPSILPSAPMTSSAAGRSSSSPPWLCGTNMRKTPIDLSVSTRSGGIRRASSISAARAAGASSRISASRRLAAFAMGGVSEKTYLAMGRPTRRTSELMISTRLGEYFSLKFAGGGSVAGPDCRADRLLRLRETRVDIGGLGRHDEHGGFLGRAVVRLRRALCPSVS